MQLPSPQQVEEHRKHHKRTTGRFRTLEQRPPPIREGVQQRLDGRRLGESRMPISG